MFSFKHDFKGMERLSFEADDFVIAADAASPALSAKEVEFMSAPVPTRRNARRDKSRHCVSATGALLPGAAPYQASDISFDGSVDKIPEHLTTLAQTLEDWRLGEAH